MSKTIRVKAQTAIVTSRGEDGGNYYHKWISIACDKREFARIVGRLAAEGFINGWEPGVLHNETTRETVVYSVQGQSLAPPCMYQVYGTGK